jgi:hypothetical protein
MDFMLSWIVEAGSRTDADIVVVEFGKILRGGYVNYDIERVRISLLSSNVPRFYVRADMSITTWMRISS